MDLFRFCMAYFCRLFTGLQSSRWTVPLVAKLFFRYQCFTIRRGPRHNIVSPEFYVERPDCIYVSIDVINIVLAYFIPCSDCGTWNLLIHMCWEAFICLWSCLNRSVVICLWSCWRLRNRPLFELPGGGILHVNDPRRSDSDAPTVLRMTFNSSFNILTRFCF